MSRRVIKTENGDFTLYEPPYTREELAIVEKGLYDPPRAIARLRSDPNPQPPQKESPPTLTEAISRPGELP